MELQVSLFTSLELMTFKGPFRLKQFYDSAEYASSKLAKLIDPRKISTISLLRLMNIHRCLKSSLAVGGGSCNKS